VIAVSQHNTTPIFRRSRRNFTFFGGLYRDVHLLATDLLQVSPLDYSSPGVYLKTTEVSTNSARLK